MFLECSFHFIYIAAVSVNKISIIVITGISKLHVCATIIVNHPSFFLYLMEPHHINQRLGDSQLSRSRASSQVSVGESRLEGLNITEAPINVTTPTGTASSESGPSFTPNHISESRASPAFLDCPVPQALPSYPFSSQSAFVQDWSFLETSEAFEAPALRLEQPHDHVGHLNPTDRLNSLSRAFDQADMRFVR